MDLDARLEELRALGLSEPEIMDLVNRELMRMAADRRKETKAPPASETAVPVPGEVTALVGPEQAAPTSAQGGAHSDEGVSEIPAPSGSGDRNRVPQIIHDPGPHSGQVSAFSSFSGPMPPPVYARAYEELCPGFTERNLAMLEKESAAAIASAESSDRRLARGQVFALVVALAMMGVALALVFQGESGYAAMVIGAEMVALVSAFLYRERKQHETTAAKVPSLPPSRAAEEDAEPRPTGQEEEADDHRA